MFRAENKSLKSCLTKFCGIKQANNRDYECLPYKKDEVACKASKTPRKNTNRLTHLNRLPNRQRNVATTQNTLITEFFQHVQIASTLIENPVKDLATKEPATYTYYDSPPSSQSSESSQCSPTNSCENSEFQTLYPSVNQESEVYVCQLPYTAEFDGDIDLKYTERVQVLHATEDFTLVKKINGSEERGYVSTRCLTSLEEFIKKF